MYKIRHNITGKEIQRYWMASGENYIPAISMKNLQGVQYRHTDVAKFTDIYEALDLVQSITMESGRDPMEFEIVRV